MGNYVLELSSLRRWGPVLLMITVNRFKVLKDSSSFFHTFKAMEQLASKLKKHESQDENTGAFMYIVITLIGISSAKYVRGKDLL